MRDTPLVYGLRTLLVSVDGNGASAYAMTPHGRGSGAGMAPPPAFDRAVREAFDLPEGLELALLHAVPALSIDPVLTNQ